jgi:NAD(P)-dependent dehydrogenase (short-subunit alcohol dehydrogenase family)
MQLSDQVAIVTGGAVRLGKALALSLAKRGVRLAIHYSSSASQAEETVAQIRVLGGEAIAIQADLQQAALAPSIIERAAAHFHQVDILVNSAAIFEPGDLASTTEANWDKHFAINLKAPFFLSQAFAAHVGRQRRGHIVNIADWRAIRPAADHLAYTLTKASLITLTQSLALALAPNIQVNAIAPGAILPPPGQDQAYLDRLARTVPLARPGSPDEVAKALLFLLDSDFATGDLILVSGGQHL